MFKPHTVWLMIIESFQGGIFPVVIKILLIQLSVVAFDCLHFFCFFFFFVIISCLLTFIWMLQRAVFHNCTSLPFVYPFKLLALLNIYSKYLV